MSTKIIFLILLGVLCIANLMFIVSGTGTTLNVVAAVATAFSFGLVTTWENR